MFNNSVYILEKIAIFCVLLAGCSTTLIVICDSRTCISEPSHILTLRTYLQIFKLLYKLEPKLIVMTREKSYMSIFLFNEEKGIWNRYKNKAIFNFTNVSYIFLYVHFIVVVLPKH